MKDLRVSIEETKKFSQVWNHKGISIPMQEPHLQFATDYANVVLSSFIEDCQRTAAERAKKQAEAEEPKISLT